jgi:hypothetical protein
MVVVVEGHLKLAHLLRNFALFYMEGCVQKYLRYRIMCGHALACEAGMQKITTKIKIWEPLTSESVIKISFKDKITESC